MLPVRCRPLCVVASVVLVATLPAQRGRGRPEAILERVSCYLADDKVPAPSADGQDRLAGVATVTRSKAKKELSVLYIFDSHADAPKREAFEKIMFGNEELGVAFRVFHVARVDIAGEADLGAKYGSRLPSFLVYDDTGKLAADVAFTGFRAAVGPLMTQLEKVSAGHVKPAIGTFTSRYRSLVRDLEMVETKRKAVQDRQSKITDDKKRALLDKELADLDAEQKSLEAKEKAMLDLAKLPERDPAAKRFVVTPNR